MKARLFALQDAGYRTFHARLIPTVDADRIIGVRVPDLRRLARSLRGTPEAAAFLRQLPHTYYEENNLHAFLIAAGTDFDRTAAAVDAFLPYVDNWATCDSLRPAVFAKNRRALLPHIRRWLQDPHPYTRRFALEMLLCHYLDDAFDPVYLQWAADVPQDHYYVKMMVAWYFATALAKQYDAALPWLQQNRLPVWVHNKTIQKAVESYRITPERKAYLRTLKRKEPPHVQE